LPGRGATSLIQLLRIFGQNQSQTRHFPSTCTTRTRLGSERVISPLAMSRPDRPSSSKPQLGLQVLQFRSRSPHGPCHLSSGPLAPAKKVSLTINSVPQGAIFKVDGIEVGATPKIVQLTVGKHKIEFSKEGFNAGTFPVEIGPDDASGGSVSYELGNSAHDTIELRDGTVLNGDLLSVTPTDVTVRVGGAAQHFDRNQVKRVLLVERDHE
jgi:PEGA domain-containing protein